MTCVLVWLNLETLLEGSTKTLMFSSFSPLVGATKHHPLANVCGVVDLMVELVGCLNVGLGYGMRVSWDFLC